MTTARLDLDFTDPTLVDDPFAAYEEVRAARKARKASPSDAVVQSRYVGALQRAAEVPLETARLAHHLQQELEAARARTKAALSSDLVTAVACLRAATEGGLANVLVNLEDLRSAGVDTSTIEGKVRALQPRS